MRALRTLFSSLLLAALLGTFALPPVLLTGGAAYAAEHTPGPPAAVSAADKPATAGKGTHGNAADNNPAESASPSSPAPDPLSPLENGPSASRPGPLPLPSPVLRSAHCPAAPLPPHAQRLCAEAAALLDALHTAAAALPNRRDIRMGITDFNEYTALAAELYTPLTEVDHAAAGGDSGAQSITVTLLARPDAAETLLRLLRNPDALKVRRLLLADLMAATANAQQVAQEVTAADALPGAGGSGDAAPGSGGTWYIAKVTPPGQLTQHPPMPTPEGIAREAAQQQARQKADVLADTLAAAITALDTLRLSPEGWLTSADSLAALEKAAVNLPQSAAAQLLLGEALLQAGMPQRSIASCTAALELAPDLGRARYIRALAHWRLQQLALAEDDLSAALEATTNAFPHTSDKVRLLRARGALRMLRSNEPGMCDDLAAACALGDCDGLAAARGQQMCLTSPRQEGGQPEADAVTPQVPAKAGDTAAKP